MFLSPRIMSTLAKRIWRYGPLIVWMALISFASTSQFSAVNTSEFFRPLVLWLFPTLSEAKLAALHFVARKAGHFSEYAVMGLLAARAFRTSSSKFIAKYWFPAALVLVVLYALLDEYHQSFVPGRTASALDSGIDILGGLVALIAFKLWLTRHARRT